MTEHHRANPAGSIALQMPLLAKAGLDLSDCYPVTLHIAPHALALQASA